MSLKLYEENDVIKIADSIRSKNKTTNTYKLSEMSSAIDELSVGGDYNVESILLEDGTQELVITDVTGDEKSKFAQLVDGSLTEVTPEDLQGVTSIKQFAFYRLTSLLSIDIPNTVTSIGGSAFRGCTSLERIEIPSSVKSLGGSYVFMECANLSQVILHEGLETIGESALRDCAYSSIEIPDSVTSIGNYAFYGCSNLTNIKYSNNVTYIPRNCFEKTGLKTWNIPSHITEIGYGAFQWSSIENITIPASVTSIEASVFYYCNKLTEMTILATTPPTLSNTNAISTATTTIYIPYGTLNAYQTATNWSSFASKFVELNEDGTIPA